MNAFDSTSSFPTLANVTKANATVNLDVDLGVLFSYRFDLMTRNEYEEQLG